MRRDAGACFTHRPTEMGKGTIASVHERVTDVLTQQRTLPRLAGLVAWDLFAAPEPNAAEPVTGNTPRKADRPNATRASVLVVDDDPDVRTMLRTHLEIEGYAVIEAADGNQAWELVQRHKPAVVIADIQMPGRSGLELCRHARAAGLDKTGFIAYTAGMASNEECTQAGFDAHFLKTDPLPRLSRTVRRLASLSS